MAYTTINGTTETMAAGFYPGAQGQPEILVDTTLRLAERVVKNLAPTPDEDPIPTDYTTGASDAELFVFRYIFRTEGYIGGQRSLVGSSITYSSDPKVLELVRQAMGDYVGGSANIAYISTFPR